MIFGNRYLFRGKMMDDEHWAYGALLHCDESCAAIVSLDQNSGALTAYDVSPATVGQCTGLKDSNGVYIYEGDILECKLNTEENVSFIATVEFGNPSNPMEWGFQLRRIKGFSNPNLEIFHWVERETDDATATIIGNKWDTPKLLRRDKP